MNRRTINAVIIIGVLSIVSILMVQVFWINRTIKAQKDAVIIQERQDSLNVRQFEESVRVALRNTVEEIGNHHVDSSYLYGAVKQKSSNYFLVDINENLHPYYLEQLLKRTFYEHNITQDFQYGIYDCFNDSIVYGNLIRFSRDSMYAPATDAKIGVTSPQLRWKRDGHYFTVYFPEIISQSSNEIVVSNSPWLYFSFIIIVLLIFFAFSVSVIIKQKRMSEVKADFVNNMTHELKTPISTIGLSSELLMQNDFSKDPERLKKYAEVIYKENKRLEEQVERVLNMAKLDRNELDFQVEPVDMHALIEETAENFRFNQTLTGGEIVLELNAERTIISADLVHITNVILNLLDNAVKYSEDPTQVKVSTKNKNKGIEISIQDNGIGIEKEQFKQVFDKFYRVPTGDRHDVKGFGLGLYYVKLIIDKHGGKMSVKSKLDQGSTFTFWIPTTLN
ncbi:HAMP domain-containing histidine kinase [Brumimicrobium glaciale]|uniref:histidine kinase n=1 Tax=Brumimicrobium glaciale TaxID=200475 RepID=A0A4Q4KSL8_9FLAO|nr:HAMP domain-containing sensor histidine kinase [Brumimicrobium glaciale]RYM36055.1 HAMP domain-containing histidine kinase [Brumimicrobium glaciale]